MNGLSPNLDLRRLPRKRVMYLMDRLRTWDSLSSQAVYDVMSVAVGISRTSED